jgi:hypothetical protein
MNFEAVNLRDIIAPAVEQRIGIVAPELGTGNLISGMSASSSETSTSR